MRNYSNVFLSNSSGTAAVVASPTVTVTVANASVGTGAVASIYSDDGVTPKANPFTGDANGNFSFYVADGRYDITLAKTGYTTAYIADEEIIDRKGAVAGDGQWIVADLDVTTECQIPTAAPGAPAAGDIWEDTGVLKHGASSKAVADLATEQTFTAAQTITAPASAGKVALTVKGHQTAAADVLDVYDSAASPAIQSWFDSTGEFNTNLDIKFKSGTANTVTFSHNASANRTITIPDAAGTVALTTAPATTGTDISWSAAGQLSVPNAGASERGVVSTSAQTFAGAKTFAGGIITPDSTTYIQDNSDATKQLQFQLSGITTGNTRTLTIPDASGTVALTTAPGTSGNDVAWSAAGQLLVPDAGATARGAITTGSQTIAGAKTFTGNVAVGGSITNGPDEALSLPSTGKVGWDDTTGTIDTNVYRGAANQLKTDDTVFVVEDLGVGTAPSSARLHVEEQTIGDAVLKLESVATNDDVLMSYYQARLATTNATQTTAFTYAVPSSTTVWIEAYVVARRTGGAAGSAEDGAGYVVRGTYKNVAGTATLIGSVNADYTAESQAGWDATFTVSSGNVLLSLTGAVDNNVTWHATIKVMQVSS